MDETWEQIVARLPSDADLVRDFINGLRRRRPASKNGHTAPDPLWVRVRRATFHGSGFSTAICIKYGFNPEEKWRPE